jgi:hypothetical protein
VETSGSPRLLTHGHQEVRRSTTTCRGSWRLPPRRPLSPSQTPKADETRLKLAMEIDRTMREQAPAGWKGDQARGAQVLNTLFPLLDRNHEATLALFDLVKHQPGYE